MQIQNRFNATIHIRSAFTEVEKGIEFMDREQIQFLQEKFRRVIIENAFGHIVGVAYTLKEPADGSPFHLGSGFCTTIEGRTGWITARHVIDDIRRQLDKENLQGNALIYGSASVGVLQFPLNIDYFRVASVVFPESTIDVAFVPMSSEALEKISKAGIKQIEVSSACCTANTTAGIYVAYGFATEGSHIGRETLLEYVKSGKQRQVSRYRLEGVGMQSVQLARSPDASSLQSLALPFIEDAGSTEHTMFPVLPVRDVSGMSGGPIIYHDYDDPSLAEFRLYGIQSRQSTTGDSVKSMTLCDARYAFESIRAQLS